MYHLCAAHHVPEVMRGMHIMKGYRFNYTWQMCLKSVFRAHNETLNVWTHFIGFLIFAGLLMHTILYAADETPVPRFPSTNFTFLDMAQKYYDGFTHESFHTTSPFSFPSSLPSFCSLPSTHATCPVPSLSSSPSVFPMCPLHNDTSIFATFPAFSSHSHPAFSYLTSLYCNLSSFPPLPTPPSFSFDLFPSFSADAVHTDTIGAHAHALTHDTHAHRLEHAMKTKTEELKKFLADCRDHFESKMHSIHDSFEVYLKEIEDSVHEFSTTHKSVAHFSERLSKIQQFFDENLAKFFNPKSKLPIMVFLLSGMACFMGSTLYHTFGCQSAGHCNFFLKVDYSGISTLIAGSLVPFVWYVFHGLTHWQCFYIGTLVVLATLVLYVSFSERFSSQEYQPYRALCFVLMAAFALVPFLHMVFLYRRVEFYSFQRCFLSASLYILAVAAYVSRVPERLFPGKCDFWLQSHQVFHTFIVAAALVWYSFSLRLLDSNTYIN